jgi:hypothetical protein
MQSVDTRILAGTATSLLIIGACTSGAEIAGKAPAPPASETEPRAIAARQRIRVTRDSGHGPEACHPQQVGETVIKFFAAIHDGRVEVESFFAADMEWYSASEWSREESKRHFVSRGFQPQELDSYFERRISQHEQLHLLEIDVAYERARNLGTVAYAIHRSADDLPNSDPIAIGKGAIDCDRGTIAVWSMSHDIRFQRAPAICPGEAKPPTIAIACARA